MVQSVRSFLSRNERYIGPGAMALGFVIDNFTLTRIDQLFDNLILATYLLIIAFCSILLNMRDTGGLTSRLGEKLGRLAPIIFQFAIGGLFSGYVIFYSRSASLVGNWPFVLGLIALLIGNEFFRTRYNGFQFRLTILYISIFTFSIFSVPVLVKSVSAWVFVLSGLVSLLLIYLLLRVMDYLSPAGRRRGSISTKVNVGFIFVLFNMLYFSNTIPPIPLSLTESGVYHFIERAGDSYNLYDEDDAWHDDLFGTKVHVAPAGGVYVYSSVFAPTDLSTTLKHRWSYFNEDLEEWQTINEIPYQINGGRDGGYRGYTYKSVVIPGQWRVDVLTKRDQVLGRVAFEVIPVPETPELTIKTR